MSQSLALSPRTRARIEQAVRAAPDGHVVTIAPPTRSSEQNARLWALLGQFARLWPEHRGIRMDAESWKVVFMAAAGFKPTMLPDLDGTGFIASGYRSSRLNKREFGDLMEAIEAEAARRGVVDLFTGEAA